MSSIFNSCERWNIGMCRNEMARSTFFQSESEVNFSSRIHHLDLEKLDIACRACDIPLKIQRRECPACGSHLIQNDDIPLIEIDTLKIYNYCCSECNRELFSYFII